MATFTVTNTNDSGRGSLRQAIIDANASAVVADTIEFDAALSGQTIRLASTLVVTDLLTIDGDIDNDGVADILITGDVLGNDATPDGDITDIAASAAIAVGSGTALDDNVQIIRVSVDVAQGQIGDLTLDGLILTGGVTNGNGGAISSNDDVTLTNTTVSGNSAGDHGGGIAAVTATLTNSTVSGNSAGDNGGGIFALIADLTNSTVSGNMATVDAGGILAGFDAILTNSTVSGNSAVTGDGGGILATVTTLTNSTVSGNGAGGIGGGLLASVANLTNSIVLGNDAPSNGEMATSKTNLTGGNIIGTDVFQGDTIVGTTDASEVFAQTVDIDPGAGVVLAGVLADNGGPVQTIALNTAATNPALDAGDDTATAVPATDARGFSRDDFAGAANNGTNISDLGAFEASHELVVTTLNDVVDSTDGLTSLREAITLANGTPGADTITFATGLNGTIRLDGGDGPGGTAGGTLQITDAVTISGDGRILISGDVADDDTTVGATDITDIFATAGTELDDNVRIIDATADLTLDGLTLTGGVATGVTGIEKAGGAIRADAVTLTLTNTTVSGNSAVGGDGGGILAANVIITSSTVSGNSGGGTGGGINATNTATLINSTVSGNSGANGGGISANTVDLTNTTVSGNTADSTGGGLDAATATLINSTVSGNSAVQGGGISAGTANLTNSIVLGNDASTNAEVSATTHLTGGNILGANVFQGSTDVGNTSAAEVFAATVDIDPGAGIVLAGVLADSGGPVETIALRDDLGNPALDASNGSAPANDARGEARQDWAGIANQNGSAADLGAFELQNAAPTATNLTQAKSYMEDAASVALDDIVVSDADGGDTITATLTLANPLAGALTTSGAATYTAATGVWTITGTVVAVNAGLAAVAFVPTAENNLDTTITTHIEDAGGAGPADGTILLDVTPVDDAPVLGSLSITVAENTTAAVVTATAADIDGPALTFSLTGDDAALFVIDAATGALAFASAPDFEAPADANHDNVYDIVVNVSDGTLSDTQAFAVSVTDIDGVRIIGSHGNDTIDATHSAPGQPLPTGEEDIIKGLEGVDRLSGLGGDDLIRGGRGKDFLDGGDGDDMLFGGFGKNKVTGGDGDDRFVFDTKLGLGKVGGAGLFTYSRIADFGVGDDLIALSKAVFKKLDLGVLSDVAFRDVGEKASKDDRIVYKANGDLIYDKDGKGGHDGIVFAKLAAKPDIDAADFLVII